MVLNREQAAQAAERATRNEPGTCQKWTREIFGAPSVGDRDRDGDADAVDGWSSEPQSSKHYDRNPPRGVPIAWAGGSNGYGHRAISLGNGLVRSTDAPNRGVVGTVTLDWFERNWGLRYLGWSTTISGQFIPIPAPVKQKKTRGKAVGGAIWNLGQAKGEGKRGRLIAKAREYLFKIKPF